MKSCTASILFWLVLFSLPYACGAAPKPATIISPGTQDRWAVGSRHQIEWHFPGKRRVTLAYRVDDNKQWKTIAEAVPNTGQYLWTIPEYPQQKCQLRVVTDSPKQPAILSESFLITPSQQVHDYHWKNITNQAAFAPRDGAGALVYKNKMWLIGGWNPRDKKHFPRICNNEVWSSTNGADWTLQKPNTFLDNKFDPKADWEGRHVSGYVVFQNKMWIVGGDGNQGHHMFDVWNSSNGKQWKFVNPNKPVPWGPRALHHTVVFQDQIWVMGGQTSPPTVKVEEKFYRDIWTTKDGINWKEVVPDKPYWTSRSMIAGSVVMNKRMWILGGGTYETPKQPKRKFYNDVWSSADGIKWTRHVAAAPWAPRQFHSTAVYDNRMWVLTGYNQPLGELNDAWYSSDGVNWYEVPNSPWSKRHAVSVFVYDNALWMTGGPTNRPSEVWKLSRGAANKPQ